MTLNDLLAGAKLGAALPADLAATPVAGLDYDSRRIEKGFVFFAFAGEHADGRSFARDAMDRGAVAAVSELPPPERFPGPWIQVENGRHALAAASRIFYHAPDERVFFTGITGTNGKTTTAFLADSILRQAGFTTGLIGTIEYRLAGQVRPAPNTTPESLDTMRFAAELVQRGGTHLVSEVSSHALALGRVHGFRYHTAVFTNLSRDHLDFHPGMQAYRDAKRMLFRPAEGPAPAWAVLNAEDPASSYMAPEGARTVWYGRTEGAALRPWAIRSGVDGLRFDLCWEGSRTAVESPLVGEVNVLNILAAAGVALSYGVDLETIAKGVAACRSVPGRFERIDAGQPFLVLVDYAHTDDALRNALRGARGLTSGRVITLFGCGGDRDRAKRPLMAKAAAESSDFVVLTSDNPRSEDPLAIMDDALAGMKQLPTPYTAEPDRAPAIRKAIQQAQPGDVVLLAGKGHETYQILKDRTIPFDDRKTALAVLESLGYGRAKGA